MNAYPWHAALGYKSTVIRYLCGGTLITQKHVITAGHCVIDSLVIARLGEYDITSDNDGASPIDANIILKVLHESFDPKYIANDIGLLKLDRILTMTISIRPICLPLADDLRNKDYTYAQPWVIGWGSLSFRGPTATILQEVQVPIIPTTECEFNYRLYFPNQVFDNRIMCAGYAQGGKDSCQGKLEKYTYKKLYIFLISFTGDSGGSLVLPQLSTSGQYYYYNLIGIVSYGFV